MASLLDLDRSHRKVTVVVKDTRLEVVGLTPDDFTYLIVRFASLRKMLEEGKPWDSASLLDDVIAEVIACGFGMRGHPEALEIIKTFSLGEQIAVADAIINDLTFTEGFGPFVERLKKMGLFTADTETKTAPQPSRRASSRSSDDGPNALLDFSKAAMVHPQPAMAQ